MTATTMTSDERLDLIHAIQPDLLKVASVHEGPWIADHIQSLALPSPEARLAQAREIVARRLQHEPLAYIFGQWSFMHYEFRCGPGALIPRPETEEMCEAAVQALENSFSSSEQTFKHGLTIVDFGAGTGCLGLSFVANLLRDIRVEKPAEADEISRKLKVILIEKSPLALPYLKRNVAAMRPHLGHAAVEVFEGSWTEWTPSPAHVVLSNPPYVTESEYAQVDASVRDYEPKSALVPAGGGRDGIALESYVEILHIAKRSLVSGGWIWFELGTNQHLRLQDFVAELGGFNELRTIKDMARKPRFFCARKH